MWSALLMPRSRHSRTALVCTARYGNEAAPMFPCSSPYQTKVHSPYPHGRTTSAVLFCRLRGSKRADLVVLHVTPPRTEPFIFLETFRTGIVIALYRGSNRPKFRKSSSSKKSSSEKSSFSSSDSISGPSFSSSISFTDFSFL